MSDINQIMNNIKALFTTYSDKSVNYLLPNRIITYLCDLRTKEKYQSLSDLDYYDIVGQTFKLNPEFFMASIYGARKLYKHVDRKEMAKHIIKKYCLYDGEEILYECHGSIKQGTGESDVAVSVSKGFFFVTTRRIIAQGTFKVSGGRDFSDPLVIYLFSGVSKRARGKKKLIESSLDQELPCYGYQFQIKNHVNLKKSGDRWIKYKVIASKCKQNVSTISRISWKYSRITLPSSSKDKLDDLFQVLCKDANQIVDSFRAVHETGMNLKSRRRLILSELRQLWNSEEYQHFSESDYLNIVKEAYKLDPELFMTSIYPKMILWKFTSFLNVKDEVITLIDKLSKEFVPPKPEQGDDSIKFIKE